MNFLENIKLKKIKNKFGMPLPMNTNSVGFLRFIQQLRFTSNGGEIMKTNRGFEIQYFHDDYGVECSIQESSVVEPHIWLGVAHNDLKVMAKDKQELLESVLHLTKDYPECNEMGWCTVPLPREALIENRMHLNRKQAKELAKKLNYFAKHGVLKEEKEERSESSFTFTSVEFELTLVE